MEKYKLVAVDMDGTLLNSHKEITPKTLAAINEMVKRGYIFAFSTGRPYIAVERFFKQIDGNIALILYNGAIVTFSRNDEVLLSVTLTKAQSEKIYKVITENNGTYVYWCEEKLYVSEINDITLKYQSISKAPINIIDPNNIPHGKITKMIWFDENSKLKEYQKTVLKDFDDVNFFTSQPTFLEFAPKDVSKALAMEALAKYYGIKKEEMIAIGDGCNDIPMLEYAGLAIAMANAEDEVKAKAGFITSSNDNDGVGEAIDKFILNNSK